MNNCKKYFCSLLSVLCSLLLLSGCVVRTYSVTKDRVDQDISGNQGYLSGSAPQAAAQPKKFTQRTTKVVEIEFRKPVEFKRLEEPPRPQAAKEGADVIPAVPEQPLPQQLEQPISQALEAGPAAPQAEQFDAYVVRKDDTLQKISLQFYGTTKKWMKIFEANKDKLKSPDKVRPGQTIRIPKD